MSKFGKNIKKIRNVRGLTQAQLAEMIEVNRGVISSYEEGRAEPKIETIIKTAEVFQLSIDLLLKNNLTVNQLSGFSLPEMTKITSIQQQHLLDGRHVFDFLPKGSRAFSYQDLAPCSFFKQNDTILALPAKPILGKLMLLQTAQKMYVGKIASIDANEISLDHLEQPVKLPNTAFEILGVYTPFQQVSPLEERVQQLEVRLEQVEAKLQAK